MLAVHSSRKCVFETTFSPTTLSVPIVVTARGPSRPRRSGHLGQGNSALVVYSTNALKVPMRRISSMVRAREFNNVSVHTR